MGKLYVIWAIGFYWGISNAQIDGSLLMGLTQATTIEMNSVSNPIKGSLLYNTEDNQVYVYNGTQWNAFGGTQVFTGVFTISNTGTMTITGLPFKPSQISFTAHANVESLNLNSDNATRNNDNGISNSFGTMNGFVRDDSGSMAQQVIYVGGSGNSINDISRYASSTHCIGVRYGNQNGDNLGITSASISSLNSNGFTINVDNNADDLVVLYKAYQ